MTLFHVIKINNTDCIPKMIMNGKYVRIWKETAVIYFKALSWHTPEETEENIGESQLGWTVTVSRFETGTFRAQV